MREITPERQHSEGARGGKSGGVQRFTCFMIPIMLTTYGVKRGLEHRNVLGIIIKCLLLIRNEL